MLIKTCVCVCGLGMWKGVLECSSWVVAVWRLELGKFQQQGPPRWALLGSIILARLTDGRLGIREALHWMPAHLVRLRSHVPSLAKLACSPPLELIAPCSAIPLQLVSALISGFILSHFVSNAGSLCHFPRIFELGDPVLVLCTDSVLCRSVHWFQLHKQTSRTLTPGALAWPLGLPVSQILCF